MKSVQVRSFFQCAFSYIQSEYRKIRTSAVQCNAMSKTAMSVLSKVFNNFLLDSARGDLKYYFHNKKHLWKIFVNFKTIVVLTVCFAYLQIFSLLSLTTKVISCFDQIYWKLHMCKYMILVIIIDSTLQVIWDLLDDAKLFRFNWFNSAFMKTLINPLLHNVVKWSDTL